MTCRCSQNSMARLHALPSWWLGAASVRRQFQAEAEAAGHKHEADMHARLASEYEQKAANPPKPAPVLINLRATQGG